MANLDVNGYNKTFKTFVDFAKISEDLGGKKAIARLTGGVDIVNGGLAGSTIIASTTNSLRGKFHWRRHADERAANDAVRNLFKQAIIDMYGGENKIQASVKKAMLLSDYDCGKPLTASRIIAVKKAMDANGIMKQKAYDEHASQFKDPALKDAALAQHIRDAINTEVPQTPPFQGNIAEMDDSINA